MNDDSRLSVSRRTLATGAAWAVPAVALAMPAPAAATSLIFKCPVTTCLSPTASSAPTWTASTPDAGASTLVNWNLGSYTQSCITDTSVAWYWYLCPTKVVATTETGQQFTGTLQSTSCDQTNGVTVAASPTLSVLFSGYKFGFDDCLNISDTVGFLYKNKLSTLTVTYYLQFVDLIGNTVATSQGSNCQYTTTVAMNQKVACGVTSSGGTPASFV